MGLRGESRQRHVKPRAGWLMVRMFVAGLRLVVVDEENRGMTTGQAEEKGIVNENGTNDHLAMVPIEIEIVMIVGQEIERGTAGIRIAIRRRIGIGNETGNVSEEGRGTGGMRVGIVIISVIAGMLRTGISRGGDRKCRRRREGEKGRCMLMLDSKRSRRCHHIVSECPKVKVAAEFHAAATP